MISIGNKRHSSREKKPVSIQDLGYVDKGQGRRGGYTTSEGYKRCEKLLNQLKKHLYAGQFMVAPVDIPGYTDAIKEPMDLNTVERKLKGGQYQSSFHFALDIRKIWNNSWEYNERGSDIFNCTNEISGYFDKLMKEVGDVQFVTEFKQEVQDLKKKITGALKKIDNINIGPGASKSAKNILDREMTIEEKNKLKEHIVSLPQDKLAGVISIIQDTINASKNNDVLEFDIDSLPARKCRELEQYVEKVMGGSKPVKKKLISRPQLPRHTNVRQFFI